MGSDPAAKERARKPWKGVEEPPLGFLGGRRQPGKATYHMPQKADLWTQWRDQWWQVWGGEGRAERGDFPGRESTLCDTVVMDACHCMLVQTHRHAAQSDPDAAVGSG